MAMILKPTSGGRPIVLDKPIILIGRHPDCDVIIKDSQKISRKHCCVALVDTRFVVRDLDSMNGVWINGDRVEHSADLGIGDELIIGDVPFELSRNGTTSASSNSTRKRAPAPVDEVDESPSKSGKKPIGEAGPMDAVEFSSAFAVPLDAVDSDDDFVIPLAEKDD